jgi:exoribonuclease II
MQVLYEEAGELKVGSVLAQAPATLHVESPHGRRSKIKAANVVLEFERPAGLELLEQAARFAADIDIDFLWQCSGAGEFAFLDLAREYVGREPAPIEAAGVLLALQSAPIYFHRRGRGRFQAAPESTIKLALAAVEKKKRIQEQIAQWTSELKRSQCPPAVAALRDELLYAPDRNKPETKALEQACKELGVTTVQLFDRCGLLPDAHDYHLNRFLRELFPGGVGFPAHDVPQAPEDLPLAEAPAYSLDDVGTTEIDDAFSVVRKEPGVLRVGIHIAAPALGFAPASAMDGIARERLSTAYMPGRKFTMLPEDVITAFSLDERGERAAVSLYVDVAEEEGRILGHTSRLERVAIAQNLRHAQYEALNETLVKGESSGLPFEGELRSLWRFANALESRRGKPSAAAGAFDYSFHVEDGKVRIVPRKRGAPLDKLVSEMMILANTTWGGFLAEHDVAAVYRVQSTGKVRLSVHPEPHEGLGVSCYAWMSSPLRRYVDLVNQWQLAAALGGRKPPFTRTSDAFLSALRAFEVTYARYDEHQRAMEHFWALRWLVQEQVRSMTGVVLRENLVRMDGLPLVARVSSLPAVDPGTRVRLDVSAVDLLERNLTCVYRGVVEEGGPGDCGGAAEPAGNA